MIEITNCSEQQLAWYANKNKNQFYVQVFLRAKLDLGFPFLGLSIGRTSQPSGARNTATARIWNAAHNFAPQNGHPDH
jgi:hypothetical protein